MRRAMIFIHVFLAVQLAVPLSYYTCREDTNDERFAWRMFSSTRMLRCAPAFTIGDDERPARMQPPFHYAWLQIGKRGRLAVVRAMVARLCADHPGEPVRVRMTCTTIEGETRRYGGVWNACTTESL